LEVLRVFTDGASRGNPGEAGFGVVILDGQGTLIEEVSGYLGITTNNVAEYSALIAALKAIAKYGKTVKVEIFSDSELIVRQIGGRYKVKSPSILPLFEEAQSMITGRGNISLAHIPREKNRAADALANRAVDRKSLP
jgi:ribonuclease HI